MISPLANIMPALWTHDQGAYFLYSPGESVPVVVLIVILFILFMAASVLVLWIIMPFSVFGMKGLLRQCISQQKKTNDILEEMIRLEKQSKISEMALPEIKPLEDEPRDF